MAIIRIPIFFIIIYTANRYLALTKLLSHIAEIETRQPGTGEISPLTVGANKPHAGEITV